MKYYTTFCSIGLLALGSSLGFFGPNARSAEVPQTAGAQLPAARKIKFDFDWLFLKSDNPAAAQAVFDDSSWRPLDLPHDWSIEGPLSEMMPNGGSMGFLPGGIGWYRKHFTVPSDWAGRKVFIQFDGVYHKSDVYINGQHLGFRPYGYVSFEYDLTPYLKPGAENVVAVRVDHSDAPTSRWYSGSGIYRHVWLSVTDTLHVARWGTYVTTPEITAAGATVRARTTVRNEAGSERDCQLESVIEDKDGRVVATALAQPKISAGVKSEFDQTFEVKNPALWSIEQPNLYTLRTTIKEGRKTVDEYRTPFGIRQVHFDPTKGFSLNGKNMKLKGVCLHEDAGCLGVAVPDRALERRLKLLKELGCNAIRTSHNPPTPELLDLCDRMGFVVIDEAFDKWRSGYYAAFFDQWWRQDLDAMLLRDRNHPSIILWSVGNEVPELGEPEGTVTLKMLADHVRKTDPTRLVTCAVQPKGNAEDRPVNSSGFAEAMDVVSLNYQEPYYESDKKAYPNRIILGSEVYPYFNGRLGSHKDYAPNNPWYDVVKHDYVVGQFIWAGIDYLGESTAWPSKGWPTGPIDTCGFFKPFSYFHRSVWRDEPLVHVAVVNDTLDVDPGKLHWGWPKMASHWNFKRFQGELVRVETVTNCESVELILNGQSLGVRKAAGYLNSTILWHVPFAEGKIEAIGMNQGKRVATHELQTAGPAAKIVLIPDRTDIAADGQDLSHIEVHLVDANGVLVPDDDCSITWEVTGAGRLLGLDNGDLRNHESYKGTAHTTYWGKGLAVIQAARSPGTIRVTATAGNLPPTTVTIQSHTPKE